ncbi:MAG TPA: prolipoprotein diacylglyceryl transferase [Elusimicrobiota bacterium]|nr:prolipoprotein diacylglyceryl transferase [Elusimicrobiota bacterium]
MHPTLLKIGSFELSTYGVLVATAYVAAIMWLKARRKEMGLSEDRFWDLIYWLFAGALLGGKLGYVIVEHDVTLLWHDVRYGFVFYGGFLGAALAGWIAARRMKLSFTKLSDYFAVALPIGHAIGRLGCLMAGCCYGRHTDMPWGIALDGDPSRHPTQLYEAFLNLVIAYTVYKVGLARTRDGRWKAGSAFLLYIGLYAVARFVVEIYRGDDRGAFWHGLSPSQVVAIGALAAVTAVAAARKRA